MNPMHGERNVKFAKRYNIQPEAISDVGRLMRDAATAYGVMALASAN